MTFGYLVIRAAQLELWVRVARTSEQYAEVAWRSVVVMFGATSLWLMLALVRPDARIALPLGVALGAMELIKPKLTQGRATGTPWHPHHIAERYGLLVIIALGEGVVGAVAATPTDPSRWNVDTILVAIAGVGIPFGLWWTYFGVPFGGLLHARPKRGFAFGYGHIAVFAAIAAVGAGLHLVGLAGLDGVVPEVAAEGAHAVAEGAVAAAEGAGVISAAEGAAISARTALAWTAAPVLIFNICVVAIQSSLAGRPRFVEYIGLAAMLALIILAWVLAGFSVGWGLITVIAAAFAPVVTRAVSSSPS
jgi:low temperature requirement protein LtrA